MKKNIIILLLLLCSAGAAMAQSTLKTAYFMDRMPQRHEFNPALMNEYGYLAFPALGDINVGFNSNLSIDKFLFPLDNGNLGTFLHPEVNSAAFLDGLHNTNIIAEDFNIALFSMATHSFGGYTTFDISVRQNLNLNLSKSLFEFMVGSDSDVYNMSNTSVDMTAWAEVGLGHAHRINDNLTIGVKLKYLMGGANVTLDVNEMQFESSSERARLALDATGNAAVMGLNLEGRLEDMVFDSFDFTNGLSNGFGVDLGAVYEMGDFTFSASVTDIGFINWVGASNCNVAAETTFEGVTDLNPDNFDTAVDDQLSGLMDPFMDLADDAEFTAAESFRTTLNPKFNLAGEYRVGKLLSAGAIYTATFGSVSVHELMGVLTFSPAKWFDIALSGTTSTYGTYWGFGVNFCPRFINFYIGSDSLFTNVTPQYIPYDSCNLNLKFGMSIPLGRLHKAN